jgi:putative SOS response-associated peptidase YedK
MRTNTITAPRTASVQNLETWAGPSIFWTRPNGPRVAAPTILPRPAAGHGCRLAAVFRPPSGPGRITTGRPRLWGRLDSLGGVCGRMTATTPKDALARLLEVDEVGAADLPPSWNVAPTQPIYAVSSSSAGARRLRALRWGLIPSWAKDPRIGARLINARSETVSQRPAFRSLIGTRRALVPASGFYEWRRRGPRAGSPKQPFYFQRPDGEPLVFAGLWDLWLDAEERPLRSCTIITTAANKTMAPVHSRMPVVLSRENWAEWLYPGPLRRERLAELLTPAPEGLLSAYPVSTAVNKALNDGPELIAPRPAEEELWSFPAATT